MNFEDIMLGEISQTQEDKYCMIPLCEVTTAVKFIERGMVVARGWGKGRNVELVFNGYRVSVLQDERSFGDG